jgi:hypothetical protein
MLCYNSGCSFTTPNNFIKNEEMYWYLLAKDRGCNEFINESRSCSSNDLILQRVYNHVLSNLDSDVFYTINITSTNRIELEQSRSDKLQEVLTPESLSRYDFETAELTLCTQLTGIISFLMLYNKDFYIINNNKELNDSNWPKRNMFVNFLKKEHRALNLFKYSKFNFHKDVSKIKPYDYDLYGWSGHDGPEGHYAYYSKLKTLV